MSKVFLMLLLALAATACANRPPVQSMPMRLPEGSQGLIATCDGKMTNWNYCYDTAAASCANGYEVSGRNENAISGEAGVSRSLYFKCK
jgi:hypothetical protein